MINKNTFLKQLSKEVHRRTTNKFKRRKVIAYHVNDMWGADLADMNELIKYNNGYRYILNIIDIFSRHVWSYPLKTKSSKEVLKAFWDIGIKPNVIWTDEGKEFVNRDMKKWRDKSVKHFIARNEQHVAHVEAFNRTLKTNMWKYFTAHNTRNWIDILQQLVKQYNNTKHSSLHGLTPNDVYNLDKKHQHMLWRTLFGLSPHELNELIKSKPQFNVGDKVRISRLKGIFEKGYHHNWSYEIFTISDIKHTYPITYKLKDLNGEEIKGSFYEKELQLTKQGDTYIVEEILKTKGKGKNKQYLIKWLGYPNKFNSWVSEKDMMDI